MGRNPFQRRPDGGVDVQLSDAERDVLSNVAPQLRELLVGNADGNEDSLRRLFPPAHASEPELEADYRAMVHDELLRKRLDDLDLLENTAGADSLSADEAEQWMHAVNGIRLVLGTRLEVTEESQAPPADHPAAGQYALYEYLGYLLEMLITSGPPQL